MAKPYTVGITGGIACGKSVAAAVLAAQGVAVIDADQVARDLQRKGAALHAAMARELGPSILRPDGEIDRPRLRGLAFSDPQVLDTLNRLSHPLIRQEMERRLGAAPPPYAVAVIPLLFETGCEALCDRILVLDAAEESQVGRIMARDGCDEGLARRIIARQLPRQERVARADDLLVTDTMGIEETRASVLELHHLYLQLAKGLPPSAAGA
ncbi:MAG: dephospho-CoA kinase [Succinivibrionaceae bacterium]|nr:dephospho-CoA kinase [Succinivibrionaceae bacterium]